MVSSPIGAIGLPKSSDPISECLHAGALSVELSILKYAVFPESQRAAHFYCRPGKLRRAGELDLLSLVVNLSVRDVPAFAGQYDQTIEALTGSLRNRTQTPKHTRLPGYAFCIARRERNPYVN